jgi:hypothetical protein
MNKKLIHLLCLLPVFILSTPSASAADIPVLTWEKGKAHNLVLGGYTSGSNWSIHLESSRTEPIAFAQSAKNAQGYIVYTIDVPADIPNGAYTVVTEGVGSPKTVVAGVKIVGLYYFNVLQIPFKLITILLTLVFLLSAFSAMRLKKYRELQYLASDVDLSLSKLMRRMYRLRRGAIETVDQSLFKFLLEQSGEMLHKLSPRVWSVFPIVSLFIGFYSGLGTKSSLGIASIPEVLYLLIAIIGVIDPYSGFTATVGFGVIQTLTGNITNVRSLMALFSFSIAWVAVGVIPGLFQQMFSQDHGHKNSRTAIVIFSAIFGGFLFVTSGFLTSSLADRIGPIATPHIISAVTLGAVIALRPVAEKLIEARYFSRKKSAHARTLTLSRLVSPQTVLIGYVGGAGTLYVWTESIIFALLASAIYALPLALLVIRLDRQHSTRLAKFPRNIFFTSLFVTLITFGIQYPIRRVPLDAMGQGKLYILYSSIPVILFSITCLFVDSTDKEKVEVQ